MSVKSIKIINFKSFEKLEVELGKFNVLIGANASGKSNFVQIFEFLRDIANSGLNNAVSMQGGVEYLRNINIGASENFSLKVVFDEVFRLFGRETEKGFIVIEIYETIYEFALKFKGDLKRGLEFEVVRDNLTQKCEFVRVVKHKKGIEKKEELGPGEINISRVNGEINVDLHKPEGVSVKEDEIFPTFFLREENLQPNTLLLEILFFYPHLLSKVFSDISIYDFDPKLPKKAIPITGKAELEEDGSNLSIVLKNIIEHKNKKIKLFNLVKDLIPFIDDLDIEKFGDKSFLFKLRETYSKKQYLPASLISDGTINITALIIALYFEEKPLAIIEEPERNIHPYIIAKVVDMMKDVSQKKQIIVTTHNPEIVKHTDLENLLLMSRDKKGFSRITRPADNEKMKIFLKNEIGIDELYVQNLLGV